ncbi:titin-like isoform X23, partial [Lates japonicus]
ADLDNGVVHSYSFEKDQTDPQMDQYRDRTTLIHEDLIRGIMSLKISSLTLTDSGLYTCYVPGLADSATITLTVVRKDQDNRTNLTTIEPEKSGTLVVDVAQTFYQAEENHHITLEWTFTPKTLSSSNIYIFCEQLTDQTVSVLFHLYEGVEVSKSQDEQFSRRVQFGSRRSSEKDDSDFMSRLRTEDSGLYLCEVNTESGSNSGMCRLSVTGAEKMNVGAIVGGVLSTVVALILVLIILRVLVKRRNLWMRWEQEEETTPNNFEMEKLS